MSTVENCPQGSSQVSPTRNGGHSFRALMDGVNEGPVGASFGTGGNWGPRSTGFGPGRLKSRPDRVACGTIWPHGEFSMGYAVREAPADPLPRGGVAGFGGDVEGLRRCCAAIASTGVDPLGLSLPSNSHTGPRRPETYGRRGITAVGKKMVRAGATLLQRQYGRRRLSFLTLTLPPLPESQLRAVGERWGDLVRQLVQFLTRRLERQGLPKQVILVTECQPRRSQDRSLGCLHVHAIFVGRKHSKGPWSLSPQLVRAWWLSALTRITGARVESESCEELRMVKSSAAGYLGKYMSKGSESAVLLAAAHGWECLPRQWWSMNKAAKAMVQAAMLKGETVGRYLESLIWSYFDGPDKGFPGVLFCHQIEAPGGPITVGYYGRLSEGEREWAVAVLESLR